MLGVKFGCDPDTEAPRLLRIAQKLGLNVVGVSFHVGSGCENFSAYSDAIQEARVVFDLAKNMGFHVSILDIGGGYPGVPESMIKVCMIHHIPISAIYGKSKELIYKNQAIL